MEVKAKFSNIASLIECNLKTGRTHQIRVQFANNGNHLIGDKVYYNPKTKKRYLNKNNQNIFNLLKIFPDKLYTQNILVFCIQLLMKNVI